MHYDEQLGMQVPDQIDLDALASWWAGLTRGEQWTIRFEDWVSDLLWYAWHWVLGDLPD